jgi:shikimate dehydrogenase
VKNDKGRLIGFNTDGYGFMKAFDHFNIAVAGQKILLLGAGGAARAVLGELLARRCQVTVINRSLERARQLEQEFNSTYHGAVSVCTATESTESYYCLINTTPVGMAPATDELPVDASLLKKVQVVYDLIYNPRETKLLKSAKEQGCTIINGFPMLFYQAVKANSIWTGKTLSDVASRELFQQVAHYLESFEQE